MRCIRHGLCCPTKRASRPSRTPGQRDTEAIRHPGGGGAGGALPQTPEQKYRLIYLSAFPSRHVEQWFHISKTVKALISEPIFSLSQVAITMGYRHQPRAGAPIDAGVLVADNGKVGDYRYYLYCLNLNLSL
jgi:hypothetical protein